MDLLLKISLVLFALTIAISFFRIIKGPSMPDRVVGLDMIGINLLSMVAAISMLFETKAYLEVILILGILSFVGTIAFSRFLERGVIIGSKSKH